MEMAGLEKDLYEKWQTIFVGLITDIYPDKTPLQAKKLAQENARYLISVFTPTTMQYTVSLRQLNYLLYRFRRFIAEDHNGDALCEKLKPYMSEFVSQLQSLEVEGLTDETKNGKLSLFDDRGARSEHFGEVYSTTYFGSFAQLAQAHRHRTLDYKMRLPKRLSIYREFYVPPILLTDDDLVRQWLDDITSVADRFPQGMMVSIRERGTYEHFILKMNERLCSCAQLEISRQTYDNLGKYLAATIGHEPEIFAKLNQFRRGSRCSAGYKCSSQCEWRSNQIERFI